MGPIMPERAPAVETSTPRRPSFSAPTAALLELGEAMLTAAGDEPIAAAFLRAMRQDLIDHDQCRSCQYIDPCHLWSLAAERVLDAFAQKFVQGPGV